MNLNIATAARQHDDHAENDRVEENDYDEENDFHHENQGLTHLLPPQPLPTEREQLVRVLSTARALANASMSSISAATNDNTISPQAANDDDSGDNDEIDDELEAVEELIAEAIRSKYEANSAKARIKALKKKMSVLQSAVFSAQGTNTVRQALKKIKKKPDA